MKNPHFFSLRGVFAALMSFTGVAAAQITVNEPNGVGDVVAEGIDFAGQELGSRWDMETASDVILADTLQISQENFSGGIYSGVSNGGDPQFFLTFQGVISSVLTLDSGQRNPIDPDKYRYFTARVRYSNSDGGTLGQSQPFNVYFYRDDRSIAEGTFGCTSLVSVPSDSWQIVTVDLWNSACAGQAMTWRDFPSIKGFRVDPTTRANVRFEYDWIRLTAEGTAAQNKTVTWSGGSAPYTVQAVDTDGAVLNLVDGVIGTSTLADFSTLPPGDWSVRVSGGGQSGTSGGPVTVNAAPQFNFTQPDLRGDEANSYAHAVVGNPWGPIEAADVELTRNISNVSYANPTGSITGTSDPSPDINVDPTGDPYILWQGAASIDTERYRLLCYTLEVEGPRDIGAGSVARILYGNDTSVPFATSDDIIVQEGLNEYCIGDLRNIQLEGDLPHDWFGAMRFIRLDPLEFPTPKNFRVDEFLLSPFDTANPSFVFRWTDDDPDDNATIDLLLDQDRTPDNGNETLIVSGLDENDGADDYVWNVPNGTPNGVFQVLARLDDGRNVTFRYAEGPLQVGAASSVALTVTQPDGVDDQVAPSREYSRDVKRDAWDMNSALDVARTGGLSDVTYAGGRFSGTSTNNDPQLILLDPADNDFPMNTNTYRYVTVKLRVTGPGNHFMNVFWFVDPATFGFTDGVLVESGEWQILTLDLTDESNASAIRWRDNPRVAGLRLDPTVRSGANIEIDWVTLSGDSQQAEFDVEWAVDNLPTSTYSVFVDDADASIEIANGLATGVRQVRANLSRLPSGDYTARVIASPGPTAISVGPVTLGTDLIFRDGFE